MSDTAISFIILFLAVFVLIWGSSVLAGRITVLRADVDTLTQRLTARSPVCPRCGLPCWSCVRPKEEQET